MRQRRSRQTPRAALLRATATLSLLGALAAFVLLAAAVPPLRVHIAIGLPGAGLALAWDPLSGVFLLLLGVLGAASATAAAAQPSPEDALLPVLIAAMALALLAADGFALMLGLELMSLACWALILRAADGAEDRGAALLYLGMTGFGGMCLIGALALLAPQAVGILPDLRFAAIRAAPPDGWRAIAVLALALLGAGAKAGLVPLHARLPPAHAVSTGPVAALLSGAMTKVAFYVLIRVLFDLAGPAQPGFWGVPLLLVGVAAAVLGALRATFADDIRILLGDINIANIGLVTVGLGVALMARGADLPALASLALGAALLQVLAHGCLEALLTLTAGAVQLGAGTRRLSRLGGLSRTMPLATAAAVLGAMGMAALPPGPGFPGTWLLLQALFAAPRAGGMATRMLFAVLVALIGLAVALAGAAAVRLIGIGFLGRPRSPRAAAAEDVPAPARRAFAGLATAALAIGLFPGLVLRLAGPAVHGLIGVGLADRAGPFVLTARVAVPGYAARGYSAPGIAALLALAGGAAFALLRRGRGGRVGPAWENGFAASPPWLPFGDPATQYGGAGFSHILRGTLGAALLPEPAGRDPAQAWLLAPIGRLLTAISERLEWLQRLSIRRRLAVLLITLVLLLGLVAALEAR